MVDDGRNPGAADEAAGEPAADASDDSSGRADLHSPEALDQAFTQILAHWHEDAPTSGSARLDLDADGADGSADGHRLDPAAAAESPTEDDAPDPGHRFVVVDWTGRHHREPPDEPPEAGWRQHSPTELDEHFEPPDPALPPVHDATYWLALAGLTLGPLLVVWAAVFSGHPDPGWWVVAGIVATIGGFALLVIRGSTDKDPDDDGAVV